MNYSEALFIWRTAFANAEMASFGDRSGGEGMSVESIKIIAESIGVSQIGEAACARLADDVMYRLRHCIQVTAIPNMCYRLL